MKPVNDVEVGSAPKDQYIINGLKVKFRVALEVSFDI